MCERFICLQPIKSSSSSRSRSRRAVTSDTVSTTVGPMVSVSSGNIPFISPARQHTPEQAQCVYRLPADRSLTCAHKVSVTLHQQTNQAHSFIKQNRRTLISGQLCFSSCLMLLSLCRDVTQHRHTIKPKYTHKKICIFTSSSLL